MSSFIVVVFKIVPYLMPFLKEMLIGKKTWGQALKDNRGKTFLVLAVIASLVFNLVLMVKVGSLAFDYLALSRAKQELEQKYTLLDKSKSGSESSTKHPINSNIEVTTNRENEKSSATKKNSGEKKKDVDTAADIKATFDRIRAREAAEN